jgi:dihydrolipoamide dehydrogenase
MEEHSYDVVVVGGGPGGYVAAIRSAQLKLKTALIEREHLGGICLNWGCIPTKALLRSAEVYRNMKHASSYGLNAAGISFDIQQIVKRSRGVAEKLQQGVGFLLKKNKVTVITGNGKLDGPGKLVVEKDGNKTAVKAKHIILATGARPVQLKGMEADGKRIWTSKEAMIPEKLPKSLLVVGSGAMGIEFASFYNEMGVDTTIIEALPQVLPSADEEVSSLLSAQLAKQGIKIRTSTFLRGLQKKGNEVTVTVESNGKQEQIASDYVLLAMGVVGNVENLGLEGTKVKIEKGFIKVDEWMQTAEAGIYAIGDVAGLPCLAHKASHEGVICVEKIAKLEGVNPLDRWKIPYCTYSHPQVASIGMSEKQARENGHEIKTGKFPFVGNGKAVALGETGGFIKTIFDARTGELLGAHMIGAEVTEMVQGFGIAMNLETTQEELMQTIFAHPTLSEMMHEAVLAAYGKAIHI